MSDRSAHDHGLTAPYDWEHYERDFRDSRAYGEQERVLDLVFKDLQEKALGREELWPQSILEVGPGLGRITRRLLNFWPYARFSAADVALAPLAEAERLSGGLDYSFRGPLEAPDALIYPHNRITGPIEAVPQFDLVVAVEVLMHIPVPEVFFAAEHLLRATAPGGRLVTCDWARQYPGDRPVRIQNYCHDYLKIFNSFGAKVLDAWPVGLQSVFVVEPDHSVTGQP